MFSSFQAQPILSWHDLPGSLLFVLVRLGHKRQLHPPHQRLRPLLGVGGWPLPAGVPGGLGGGQEALLRMGHAQHQQPQRPHPQEELLGRASLLGPVHLAQRGQGASPTGNL